MEQRRPTVVRVPEPADTGAGGGGEFRVTPVAGNRTV